MQHLEVFCHMHLSCLHLHPAAVISVSFKFKPSLPRQKKAASPPQMVKG
jgi:hypothetical protein